MIAQMLSRVKKERKAQIEKITREVFPSLKPYRFRLGKAYFFAKIFVPYLTTAYGQPDKSLISCGFTRLDLFTSTCFCLSWCVHPTDAYAQEYENGQLGKTEMWYVLDASKDAKLVYGLKRERTEQQMRDAIAKGTLMKDLQWVPVKKDDLFFIEAGTIHAIGAGALVAEIQENSNLTYRLYDYDRVGKDGKKRELHIDKALDVANLKASADPKQPLRVLKYRQGVASELLTRCKYFEVYCVTSPCTMNCNWIRWEIRKQLCSSSCRTRILPLISSSAWSTPSFSTSCAIKQTMCTAASCPSMCGA